MCAIKPIERARLFEDGAANNKENKSESGDGYKGGDCASNGSSTTSGPNEQGLQSRILPHTIHVVAEGYNRL